MPRAQSGRIVNGSAGIADSLARNSNALPGGSHAAKRSTKPECIPRGKFTLTNPRRHSIHRFPMRTHLLVLSNSGIAAFNRCPREYSFRYVLRRQAKTKSDALRFGSLFHIGLNAWWLCNGDPVDKLNAANAALVQDEAGDEEEIDRVKAEALLIGYTARWGDERYETIAVEKKFDIHMGHFRLRGAIDAVALRDGVVRNVEHKTTGQDISGGADYWRHVVTMDPQVSTYMHAGKFLGFNPRDTLYDVIRKPALEPMEATPEEARKYTKPTKSEPTPRLYAGQREEPESLGAYSDRLCDDIAKRPDFYFARMTIVRLERDQEEHMKDVSDTADAILFHEERQAWPRNQASCFSFRRPCDFLPVCEGSARIDDDSRYENKPEQT